MTLKMEGGLTRRKASTHTGRHRNIDASSGIQSCDPSVRAAWIHALDPEITVVGYSADLIQLIFN
jgi:hypothetical protein